MPYFCDINMDDLGDIFGDFFGGSRDGRRTSRGVDMEASLSIGFDEAKGSLKKVINSILFKRSLAYRKKCQFDLIRKARGFDGCNEEDLVDCGNGFDDGLEGTIERSVEKLTLNGGNGNGGRRKDFSKIFGMMRNGCRQREIAEMIGYSMGATNRMTQSIEKVVVGFAEN